MGTAKMHAMIIIRHAGKDGSIVRLVDVYNIEEGAVRAVVDELKREFDSRYVIDTTQIDYARQSMAA